MQTEKLYYQDCNCRSFTATVTQCQPCEKGYWIELDRTAFYPEGGGQACDLGTLGTVRVLDVREKEEKVLHLCDGALEKGSTVSGQIDWARRFDLMQQHTGEHIVSGIIHKLYGGHNVGFHMGNESITIDFDVPIPQEELARIEQMANEAVYLDLPVRCWYPAREELPQVKYRSKKELPWPVRIVQVPDYDSCACCGVHVARTGQIGLVKLFSCVKFHEGVRIEMLCGARALNMLSRIYEQNRLVSQAFSAKLLETGAAARKMNEQLTAEKYRATVLERQLFDRVAEEYKGAENVLYFAKDLSPQSVRELADRISDRCSGTAAVYSGSDQEGYSVCLANKHRDIKALGQEMNRRLDGRGGGKPGFFQGSVKTTREKIEEFWK